MRNWIAFGGSVVALEMFFLAAGAPLALMWRKESTALRVAASPLFGMALLSVLSWYWSRAGFGGLAPLARPLAIVAPTVALVIAAGLRRRGVPPAVDLRQAAFVALAWLAALLLVGFMSAPIIGIGYRTSVALNNNDIPAYALMGQHLADHSLGEPGTISQIGFAWLAEHDVFGAGATLALGAGLLGSDVWKVTLPTIALVWINITVMLAALTWIRFRVRAVPALAISLASVASTFFTTIAFGYFFAQLLGFGFLLLFLVLLTQSEIRDATAAVPLRSVPLLALVVAGLVLAYPVLLVIGVAVLGGSAVLGGVLIGRGADLSWSPKRAGRVLSFLLVGLAIGSAMVPDRVRFVWRPLIIQASGDFGYPLRGLTPLSFIGIQRIPAGLDAANLALTVIVVGALLLGVAVAVRGDFPLAREMAVLLMLVLAGWLFFMARRGSAAYLTWKWLGYFQPLVVCAALALTTHAAVRSWPRGQQRARGREAVLLGLGALVALSVLNGRSVLSGVDTPSVDAAAMAGQGWRTVDENLADLPNNPALAGLTEINLNLSPFWEEMWAAYFLRHVPRVNLMTTNYYGKAPPLPSAWTLQRADLTPEAPGVRRVPVNERYVLVDKPSPPVG